MTKKKSSPSEAPESPVNDSDNKIAINTGTGVVNVSMDDLYHNYQGIKPASVLEWEREYKKNLKECEKLVEDIEKKVIQEINDMALDISDVNLDRGIELVENVMSVIGNTDDVSAEDWAGYIMMGFKDSYNEIKATKLAKKIYPGAKESKNGTLWVKKDEKRWFTANFIRDIISIISNVVDL